MPQREVPTTEGRGLGRGATSWLCISCCSSAWAAARQPRRDAASRAPRARHRVASARLAEAGRRLLEGGPCGGGADGGPLQGIWARRTHTNDTDTNDTDKHNTRVWYMTRTVRPPNKTCL